ncbi:MAG: spore protease YyaC [Bacillota bacterium]|nr:spore protease YyaC [Bacillota bacterium]
MYSSTTTTDIIPSQKPFISLDTHEHGAQVDFVKALTDLLDELDENFSDLVILCIGSDRSTGDSLGPLVGSMLEDLNTKNAVVLGTLNKPVHALNLKETRLHIEQNYASAAIIAVDACLGQKQKIGHLEIGKGPLQPGAAVNKRIPPVGDIYIAGIVNVGGFMEMMVLQSTPLSVVIPMARFIGLGIFMAISEDSRSAVR